MSQHRGLLLAIASVCLVSIAQLSMRWGMAGLPSLAEAFAFSSLLRQHTGALVGLFVGIACYGLSMLCWIVALSVLPLGRAYALLSLSYPLVYLAAVMVFGESITLLKSVGIALVMLGVFTIHSRRPDASRPLAQEEL
ncbi:4-amino-4-deoxy-L-arabinose-phosphoundecaprenol flippase subunit ArnF [Pseudomonas asuensis]|uniref:Probable 4-amino-4-deoxy-L-arabinose-phosphoundecaprenol flippase subunit ArnF n=1 Tax=Pseudomonas asuensis TaxID=1825787 RepID=A0ABQ2GHW9_9PSED|nr:4-amino-4-deoxy-L-arabinose-phosphoundecaprenol flippase subunit ArnF [Pseudomonas asuensis]GGL96395.1 putative 4-amino-4-deoxy-L-arabinose-phosphoundecaprenol flippase subunit ArnF [Pseudomonas asuensis]